MIAHPPFVLLEDRVDLAAPARLYADPVEVVRCETAAEVGPGLERLEAGLARGLHVAGFLAYELGHVLEPRLRPRLVAPRADPLLWMGLFAAPQTLEPEALDRFLGELAPPLPLNDFEAGHSRAVHMAKVERLLELIRAGDIYQANLTFPLRFRYAGPPLSLYAALRARQPTAHASVVATGREWVLSASPELFLRVTGGTVESRPMKGTAPRGADARADEEALHMLVSDPKQRAENLMITDLIRNDLARVGQAGSVRTLRLFTPETHPTFHALTSTVVAQLNPGVGLRALVAATFPCGSIVGAPKIRAAEVLAELEALPRGVYTGAIGAFAPNGDAELNVAIRTVVLGADGSGRYGVGGGVVADSDPGGEYDEARLKGLVLETLAQDFGLIETFRWSSRTGFVRLGRHLDRLGNSATAMGFIFHRRRAEHALAGQARAWRAAGTQDRRVRLLLRRSGELTTEAAPAPPEETAPAHLGYVEPRLDAADPFLRHKTTRRDAYEAAFKAAEAQGWSEALLLNRYGRLADAARSSVFVRLDGRFLTPPTSDGALPGVLRQALIEAGRVHEATLTPRDLAAAEALFIGNSLRGLRPARLGRRA